MKKLLFSAFAFFLVISISQAQITDPAKALKKVKTLLSAYNTNPIENGDKLDQARDMIDLALTDTTIGTTYKAWQTKGKVYSELAGRDVTNYTLAQAQGIGDKFELKAPGAGETAFEALTMALEKAVKKFETKDALTRLQEVATHLASVGNISLEKKQYAEAFSSLNSILDIKALLEKNDIKTLLEDKKDLQNHQYVVGYCAMTAEKNDVALGMFTELIKGEYYEDGQIHSYVYNLLKEDNEEDALKYLNEGAALFPESTDLLFSKINYYIQKEDYKTLEGELKKAIAAAPDNPSVYSALGNVYMNMFQEEYAAGNVAVSEEYFAKAKSYFDQALALDDKMFDVQYSIGSLYYNKAVEITKLMNELSYSENKKYDAYNAESKELFTTGLPYFKKAEQMNANDTNTLIALKEIHARLDDFTTSNEFKARLEKVQAGGQNEKSFF